MNVRMPAVSGQFYPSKKEELDSTLKALFREEKLEEVASEGIAPHAGYVYSGRIAAKTIAKMKKQTFVILSPNHTGLGSEISLSESDYWATPLGEVPVNKKIAKGIVERAKAEFDESAHIAEHSIEVLIPFIQHRFSGEKIDIVPVTIGTSYYEDLKKLAEALASVAEKHSFNLLASSDFSHFIPLKYAKERDLLAIKFIQKLDAEGFYNTVQTKGLSICGFAPITTTILYCRLLGRKKCKLLAYDTSATASGDKSSVVGYASLIFF